MTAFPDLESSASGTNPQSGSAIRRHAVKASVPCAGFGKQSGGSAEITIEIRHTRDGFYTSDKSPTVPEAYFRASPRKARQAVDYCKRRQPRLRSLNNPAGRPSTLTPLNVMAEPVGFKRKRVKRVLMALHRNRSSIAIKTQRGIRVAGRASNLHSGFRQYSPSP